MHKIIILALLSAILCAGAAAGDYKLDWGVVAGGGGGGVSASYAMTTTAGQPAAGFGESAGLRHWIGFWPAEMIGPAANPSVADAKLVPDGQPIVMGGAEGIVVTAVFPDCFYIESDDRSSGMRATWSGSVSVGDRISITAGDMSTTSEFERCIQATAANVVGSGLIEPLAFSNRDLGGCDLEYDPFTGAGQRGVEYCSGLNNIGLLVKTMGRVTAVGKDFFCVDDGTRAWDGSIFRGVRVRCGTLAKPLKGQFVTVTGISAIMRVGDYPFRSLRPRGADDIQIAQPVP